MHKAIVEQDKQRAMRLRQTAVQIQAEPRAIMSEPVGIEDIATW